MLVPIIFIGSPGSWFFVISLGHKCPKHILVTFMSPTYNMIMELTGEDIKRIAIEAFEDQRRMLARANEMQEQD